MPTIVLHGDEDGATLLSATIDKEGYFTGTYQRVVLPGIGHFVQREAPWAVAEAEANVPGSPYAASSREPESTAAAEPVTAAPRPPSTATGSDPP